jgi:FixJ family two-component response regulator
MTAQPAVIVVDDDPAIRESVESLLRSVGLQVRALASVPEFLEKGRPEGPACLVLDVMLAGWSGLDFQRESSRRRTFTYRSSSSPDTATSR